MFILPVTASRPREEPELPPICGELRKTIAAQAFLVVARNFLARCRGKMNFLAPASRGHAFAQKLPSAGLECFAFVISRGSWFGARGHR